MKIDEILNLIALFIIPLVAVIVGQYLQNKSEKRKDKMQIFKTLLTSRIYGWTQESVHCLNMIDIVFSEDKQVRAAWKTLYDKYCIQNPNKAQIEEILKAQNALLQAMAKSLGYKDEVTLENIQKPYIPNGLQRHIELNSQMSIMMNNFLSNMQRETPRNNGTEENNEH